MSDFFSSK